MKSNLKTLISCVFAFVDLTNFNDFFTYVLASDANYFREGCFGRTKVEDNEYINW